MADINKYEFIGRLFYQLKSRGFTLEIDDYNDALLLAGGIGNDMVALKFQLAPIISTNPSQQLEFYVIYDEVLRSNNSTTQSVSGTPVKPPVIGSVQEFVSKFWYFADPILILFFMLAVVLPFVCNTGKVNYDGKATVTQHGDTHYFNAGYFNSKNKKFNFKDFKVSWCIDSIKKVDSFAFKHTFADLKKHQFSLHVESPKNDVDTIIYGNIYPHPKIELRYKPSIKNGNFFINDTIFFEVRSNDAFQDSTFLIHHTFEKEEINNDTIAVTFPNRIISHGKDAMHTYFVPKEPGIYKFYGFVNKKYAREKDSAYTYSKKISIKVQPKNLISVVELPADKVKRKLRDSWLFAFFIMGFVLFTSAYYFISKFIYFRKKRNAENTISPNLTHILEQFKQQSLPIDVEWKNKNSYIQKDSFLINWNKGLVQNILTDRFAINIKATIKKTVNNIGIISPVLDRKSKPKRYIILVHKKYSRDAQFGLFMYLVNNLYSNNLPIDFYNFDDNFNITDSHGQVISFSDITNYSEQNSLIIFGDGYQFINYQSNTIQTEMSQQFVKWQNKILITPIPFLDWMAEEKILKTEIPIVPADINGLMDIVKILNDESGFNNYEYYQSTRVDFSDIIELKKYLANEMLLDWVCALAIYPKIYWELIIVMGNHINPEMVNYPNLLKLSRISWINQGAFSGGIRLELLKTLNPAIELKLRKFILSMIDTELAYIDNTSIAFEEREIQKYTNSFIIFASNSPESEKESVKTNAENFMMLYDSGNIMDSSLKTYIENKQNEWQTPIIDNSGAAAFIDRYNAQKAADKTAAETKIFFKDIMVIGANLALILSFLLILFFHLISSSGYFGSNNVLTEELVNEYSRFAIAKDSCYAKLNKNNDSIAWDFRNVSTSQTEMKFRKTDNIYINNLKLGNKYQLKLKIGEQLYKTEFTPGINKQYTIALNCEPPSIQRDTVIVQYNDITLKPAADLLAKELKSKGYVVLYIGMDNIKGGNEIRYYELKTKDVAQSLKNIADKLFIDQFNFNPEFKLQKYKQSIPENKTNIFKIWIKKLPKHTSEPPPIASVQLSIEYNEKARSNQVRNFGKKLSDEKMFSKIDVQEREYNYVNNQDFHDGSEIIYNGNTYNSAVKLANMAAVEFDLDAIPIIKGKVNALPSVQLDLNFFLQKDPPTHGENDANNSGEEIINNCISKQIDANNYVIYYKNNETELNTAARAVLNGIVSEAKKDPTGTVSLRSYSSTTTNARKRSENVKSFFSSNNIKYTTTASQPSAKNTMTRNTSDQCAERIELTLSLNEAQNKRILWLDDNSYPNESVVNRLRKMGITVDLASTNAQAYAAIEKNNYRFVITDIDRERTEPGVKDKYTAGFEFIQKVNFSKANIIILTNGNTQEFYNGKLRSLSVKKVITDVYILQEFLIKEFDL